MNDDDDLIKVSKNFCDKHKLASNQIKEVETKLREAIQMKAIGMSDIYQEALLEGLENNDDHSFLIKSAEKLIQRMKKKNKPRTNPETKDKSNSLSYKDSLSSINSRDNLAIKPSKDKSTIKNNNNLYARDMQRKFAHEAACKDLKEKERLKEVEGVTFTPEINRVSTLMTRRMPTLEIRMDEKKEKLKSKINDIKQNDIRDHKKMCTFKPKINSSYCFI